MNLSADVVCQMAPQFLSLTWPSSNARYGGQEDMTGHRNTHVGGGAGAGAGLPPLHKERLLEAQAPGQKGRDVRTILVHNV